MATILELLENDNVVSFSLVQNNIVEVAEECDHYYATLLNKAEMLELIEELTQLTSKMV